MSLPYNLTHVYLCVQKDCSYHYSDPNDLSSSQLDSDSHIDVFPGTIVLGPQKLRSCETILISDGVYALALPENYILLGEL
jgi:hypothetical protein